MSMEYVLGLAAGVVSAVVVMILLSFAMKKTKKNVKSSEYDERQTQVRGKGYQYGYLTLLLYGILYAIADGMGMHMLVESGVGILIGAILSLCVWGGYCIWNGAYMKQNETPKTLYLLFGVLGLSNIMTGAVNLHTRGLLEDGRLSYRVLNLLCGIMFLVFFVLFAIRSQMDEREME